MTSKHTIQINGQEYDAITGLPVSGSGTQRRIVTDFAAPSSTAIRQKAKKAPQAHVTTQKSVTLRRDIVARPKGHHETHPSRQTRAHVKAAKSPLIKRFAPHPDIVASKAVVASPAPAAPRPRVPSIATPKPVAQMSSPTVQSPRQLKEHLIAEKLAEVEKAETKPAPHKKRVLFANRPRVSSVVAASFALLLLGGYLTYLNMPSLSVKVAASQAGINAHFPEYKPDGYSFDGPIAFAPGEVTIKFKATGGDQAYTVKQSTSSWDSQAVLDNYVAKRSDSYLTYSEKGLTIYTYENKAAWVNGGILYTIDGNAPLSNEQVLRIASSL